MSDQRAGGDPVGGGEGGGGKRPSRRAIARRETMLVRLRRWWGGPGVPRLLSRRSATRDPDRQTPVGPDPLTPRRRRELTELARRLDESPDDGGPHLAARLRAVLAHDGPAFHRVVMANVHDADATTLEARVAALRAASAAWTRTRAPYGRRLARDLGARADQAERDWLALKRLLDVRWGLRTGVPDDGEE